MNKVLLIGRLARDPELRHTSNGMAVCQITVAISRRVSAGANPETDFINCTVWDKQAENVAKYLAKGRQVAVEGRIQTRSYDNNEGKKVYVTEVIANNVEFLGSSSGSTNNEVQQNNPFNNAIPYEPTPFEQMPTESTSVSDDPFANFREKIDISDNDLPF